jgi:hypothetical protein
MDTDGSDDTPSADLPAHPMSDPGLHLVPGASTTGRPRRPHRIEAVPDSTTVQCPWLRSDDEHGPWTRDQIRAELETFRLSPTGAFLTAEQRIALADLLLSEQSPIAFDGYCGLFWPRQALAPDLPSRLTETPVHHLRQLPVALRAWVRHCHRNDSWTDGEMTVAVLDGIDLVEAEWQWAVDREDRRRRSDRPFYLAKLAEYAADVGDEAELWSLEDAPLPDEEVRLDGLDPDTALVVLEASALCDTYFDRFHDSLAIELRTVVRRLLARIGSECPGALRRPSSSSIAAAVVYAAIHGNVVPRRGGNLSTESFARAVGASPSGVAARARKLLTTLGVEQHQDPPDLPARARRRHLRLGHPDLLIGQQRSFLICQAANIAARLSDSSD